MKWTLLFVEVLIYKCLCFTGGFLSDAGWFAESEKVLLACQDLCRCTEPCIKYWFKLLECYHKYVSFTGENAFCYSLYLVEFIDAVFLCWKLLCFEWHSTERMTESQTHWLTCWTRVFTEQYTCSHCSRHSLFWFIIVTTVIGSLLYLINIICHFLLLFEFAISCSLCILVQCIAANDRVMLCCFIGWIVHIVLKALQSLQTSGTTYLMLHTMLEDLVLSTTT